MMMISRKSKSMLKSLGRLIKPNCPLALGGGDDFKTPLNITAATCTLVFNVNRRRNRDPQGPLDEHYHSDLYMLQPDDGHLLNLRTSHEKLPSWCDDFDWGDGVEFELVGSCNGLLCLAHRRCLYYEPAMILNPVTGEYFNLLTLDDTDIVPIHDVVSGFGFDNVANVYKVIRIFTYNPNFTFAKEDILTVQVYTLGHDSEWRTVQVNFSEEDDDYSFLRDSQRSQVFVNGALHWLLKTLQGKTISYIIAFDVVKEAFRHISLPSGITPRRQLVDLGSNLCLLHDFNDRSEVWVMNEYGVETSWTKQYVIPRKVPGFGPASLKPVTLMDNGNILIAVNRDALFCFDPIKKSFTQFGTGDGCIPTKFDDVITHVPRSLSLRELV